MPCSAASALYGDSDHPIVFLSNCAVARVKPFLLVLLTRSVYDAACKGFTFWQHKGDDPTNVRS